MALGVIYWSDLDWPSFSTLVTGLAAVSGAVFIGRRQVAIADRQADIQQRQTKITERQVSLDEMRLRAELYDRREKVLKDIGETHAKLLSQPESRDINDIAVMHDALTRAKSLFNLDYHQDIEDCRNSLSAYIVSNRYPENDEAEIKADKMLAFAKGVDGLQEQLREFMGLGALERSIAQRHSTNPRASSAPAPPPRG